MKRIFSAVFALLMAVNTVATPVISQAGTLLTVDKNNISHQLSPTLYGQFIDISSFAADGGLVANLVSDNSFEFNDENPYPYWTYENLTATTSNTDSMNSNNPNYKTITVDGKGIVRNLGYTELYDYKTYDYNSDTATTADMGFKADTKYDFSCYIKNIDFEGTISVYLDSKSNKTRQAQLNLSSVNSSKWNELSATLSSVADEDGALAIVFEGTGSLMLDFVSLVPQNSYGANSDKWQYVSLRQDMVDALDNLNPAFIRFPGGCVCQGDNLDSIYNWKNTIGALENRIQATNNHTDDDGSYYSTTNAMGYHEYFQLCEDLGAIAVPTVNAGITCQQHNSYNDYVDALTKATVSDSQWTAYLISEKGYREKDEKGMAEYSAYIDSLGINSQDDFEKYLDSIALRPGSDEFNNYAQDILDLIEYANGDSKTSYWGAIRASNGHSEPFGIQYIAIGDENWGELYQRNFEALYAIIKDNYPNITVIASTDDVQADTVVSQKYYPTDNLANNTFDTYDRDDNSILVSDYTAKNSQTGSFITQSNISSAVEEASYMVGLERNSDVVQLATCAPVFAKINANSNDSSLVWFNSQQLVYTPNYFVQMLFANNVGTHYVDTFSVSDSIYQSVTVDDVKQVMYIKLVNTGSKQDITISLNGFDNITYATNQSISHKYLSACNEIDKTRVAPVDEVLAPNGNMLDVTLEENSVNVIRIAYGDNTGGALYQLADDIDYDTVGYTPLWAKITMVAVASVLVIFAGVVYVAIKKYNILNKFKKEE